MHPLGRWSAARRHMSALLGSISAALGGVRGADGALQTDAFLDICRAVVSVVEKLGTAFYIVKADINGNIERIAQAKARDPGRHSDLFTIVLDDVAAKQHTGGKSDTKGLLWLKRAMEFVVAIMARVAQQPAASLGDIVSDSYKATLQQYHGWMSSSAFSVAFSFVPSRESFLQQLGDGPGLLGEMAAVSGQFGAVLQEVHKFLADQGLDDPTKV